MPAHNMSAPPRMTFDCKPVTASLLAPVVVDPAEARVLQVIARVSVPALLFGLLGNRVPTQWKRPRGRDQALATQRSQELRTAMVLDSHWLRLLEVVAHAAAAGDNCAAALRRPLNDKLDLPEVERRFVEAAARLPTRRLPPFAAVRTVPAELACTLPGRPDPALALALLARTGGPVFSVGRSPAVPTSRCLDVLYEYAGYGDPLAEVL